MQSIEFQDISVRFGAVQALDRVRLTVRAGEVVLLCGPNGAGKSTLIAALLGLVRPDHGALAVDGAAVRADVAFRAHVGYMPESVAFAGNATGRDVMRFFARARGVAAPAIDRTLDEVGLLHAAGRAVRGYSRGMRQRLGLGVAILHEPALLVLDEPTGGLDQEGLGLLWRLLERWREAGRMALLASHELSLVERRVDRIAVLNQGRLLADDGAEALRVAIGLPLRVQWRLGDAAGAARLSAALSEAGWPAQPSGDDDSSAAPQVVAQVPPAALAAALATATAALAAADSAATSMRIEEPGLDEIYQAILARGGNR